MHTTTSFDERYAALRAEPATGRVHLLVVRQGGGRHATPARVEIDAQVGVSGDRWAQGATPDPESAVSLIDWRVISLLVGDDPARMHLPGDNIVVDLDLDEAVNPPGTRLRLGTALIELTAKPHTGCSKFKARLGNEALQWINRPDLASRHLRGVYARVLEPGVVAVGDRAVVEP